MRNLYIKSMLTALLLLCSTVATAHDFEVDGIYYNITDATAKTVEVTYKGYSYSEYKEYSGSVIIPSTVTYNGTTYSVTSIGGSAFHGCSWLTSIVIPNSVTSIGGSAFHGCSWLTSIVIPNSVTSIGGGAFHGCTKLASVTIGNSVTSIGNYAFNNCTGLTSIEIPNSVTSIGDYAFDGCTGLTAVHINDLAAWCRIDFSSFYSNPLYYAHNLYLNGEKVTDLVIPDGVTEIKKYAFYDCSGLASVTIPSSVTSIGESAFYGCTRLTAVYINDLAAWCRIDFSSGSSNPLYYAHNLYLNGEKVTDLVIPSDITEIKQYAFFDCTSLTSVTIPNSVTSIGEWAFYGCTGLKTVYNCSSLNIVAGSTYNGYVAYYANKVINAPNGSIEGDFVFGIIDGVNTLVEYLGNSKLDSWTSTNAGVNSSTSENTWTINAQAGDIFTFDWRVSSQSGWDKLIVTIDGSEILNESGESSGNYTHTFESAGTYTLVAQYTKDFVAHVGDDCASISNVKIASNGNASIALVLPESYNGENYVIGADVFYYCTGLASIVIPNSVTSIGYRAFYGCENLKTVYNYSSLNIVKGSTGNGYVAYYADKVINAPNGSIEGDFVFGIIDGVNTLVEYLGYSKLDSWTSTNAGVNSSTSENTWTINAQAGDILTFDWRVSSERGYDKLIVTIDGSEILNKSGEDSGNYTHTFESAGTYTFVARYTKDGSAHAGDDCASISKVRITSNGNASIALVLPENYNGENYVIGSSVFRDNTAITSIVIPNSVTSIGEGAFEDCTGLTSIEIPNSVTSIGDRAFSGCTGLTGELTIPNSVTSIGDYAFYKCTGLTSVTIPNSVTSIGWSAFYSCYNLASIEIPNSVTSIGDDAFAYCIDLTAVHINDLAAWCRIDFSSSSSNPLSYAHNLYLNGEKVTDLVIPDGVTKIKRYAFLNCSGLTSVVIPNSVTNIDDYAFLDCSGLKTVYNCSSLNIVAGSTDYGYVAYYADKVINAPNGSIEGDFAFSIKDGVNTLVEYLGNGGDVTLPKNYKGESYVIGADVFQDNTAITDVTIPAAVTSIGSNAFYGCTELKTVYNYSSLNIVKGSTSNGYVAYYADEITNIVTIGDYEFQVIDGVNTLVRYSGSATELTLPESYNGENYVIGSSVFQDNTAITGVTIPAGVTAIGDNAFFGCDGLKTVTNNSSLNIVAGSTDNGYVAYYADKVINADGSSTSIIGDYKFTSANGVNTLVEYLGDGGNITLPENYNGENYEIGANAFKDNTTITSVTIPNSVTSIGDSAFSGCSDLTSVHISDLSAWCKIDFNDYYSNPLYYATNLYLNGEQVTDLVIPSDITEIKNYTFCGCSGLTSVTIGSGVTIIDEGAFLNCSGLASVTIPNSVTSIGDYAFEGCTGLTGVTIPNSVTSIGDRAFYGCENLKTVYNCSSLDIVKGSDDNGYVAYYADKVINIPNGFIEGDFIFARTKVTSLQFTTADGLPGTVTGSNHIWESPVINSSTNGVRITVLATNGGSNMYNYNGYPIVALGELEFYDGNGNKINYTAYNVTTNSLERSEGSLAALCDGSYSTFYHSTWRSGTTPTDYVYLDVKFPETVDAFKIKMVGRNTKSLVPTEIRVTHRGSSTEALYNVWSLVDYIGDDTALVLPERYKGENYVIGADAFKDNTAITGVTIPAGVTAIGDNAFYGCENLKTVYNYSSLKIVKGSTDNGYVAYYADKVINAPNGSIEGDFAFSIKDGVNTLVEYLGNGGDVTLPENYNGKNYKIGADVFKDNTAITSIVIPNSVTSIGDYAFEGCTGLTAVYINDLAAWCRIDFSGYYSNPLSFAHNLYLNGELVTNLVIPSDITEIKKYAFSGCTGLTNVTIPNSVTSIGWSAFSGCTGLTSVEIPNSVTSIGEFAFSNCTGLTSVVIPNSVTSIENYAFRGCSGLTSIVIPNSVTSIGDYAFVHCTGLTSVTIGNSVTSIGEGAFYNCRGLTSIVIPNSVTSIENYAFNGCTGLTSITIPNSVTSIGDDAFRDCTGLTSVTIGNGVTSIGYCAFYGCTSLTSVTIPNSVTSIGNYAFEYCTGLTSIIIPNSVTSIGYCAFSGCDGLTSVTIGNSVTRIGNSAFNGCSGLTEIYSLAETPATITYDTFNKYSATLYVPAGAKEAYQAAYYWKDFTNIVEMEPETLPGDINGDSEVNVGDFASLVNLIFNSDNIDAATMAVADINGDGEVNVGDFAGLVNLIFNSGSQAAPKRAAALAATVEPSLYIEPFSIAPGEQKQIEVLLDNPGEKFSQLQFDLALPEGVEIVFDEDNFCYTIDRGSRLASVYNIDAQDVNGGVKVLALTTNPKAYIKGESGDVVLITVQAADDIADGVYDLSIDNVVLSHQDGSTVKASSTTAAITVSSTTGIINVEAAEGSDVYYDLQGRVVKEPSNGIYIHNGKKVFVK